MPGGIETCAVCGGSCRQVFQGNHARHRFFVHRAVEARRGRIVIWTFTGCASHERMIARLTGKAVADRDAGGAKLCPRCRRWYAALWSGPAGLALYVHSARRDTDKPGWIVQACPVGGDVTIRGVRF